VTGQFTSPGEMPVNPDALALVLEIGLAFGDPDLMRRMLPVPQRPGAVLIFRAAVPSGFADGQMIMGIGHLSALAGAIAEFRNTLPTPVRDQFDANQAKAARLYRENLPAEGSGWR
jgi:hypothetical protein